MTTVSLEKENITIFAVAFSNIKKMTTHLDFSLIFANVIPSSRLSTFNPLFTRVLTVKLICVPP